MIYKLIDDLREELSQKQHPVQVEHMVGRGTVIEQFLINIDDMHIGSGGWRGELWGSGAGALGENEKS